jgi:hypothetical protein
MDAVLVTYRQQLLDTLGERIDYAKLLNELAAVKPSGGWYTSVEAAGDPQGGASTITISGAVKSYDDVTALVTRLNSSATMDKARFTVAEPLPSIEGKEYITFTIEALFTGTTSDSQNASDVNPDGSLVSGGGGSGTEDIALDPSPGAESAKKIAAAKAAAPPPPPPPPPNGYETAATNAEREGAKS